MTSLAVLGLGGIGGMLAARTGGLCIGTERTVAAIRGSGLTLVDARGTTVSHPDAAELLERPVALLVVAVKSYDLDAALDRVDPAAVAGAVVLPLLNGLEHVDAIRARLAGVAVAAGSIGRVEAYSPEPGVVVQRTPGAAIEAASHDVSAERLFAVLEPLRVAGVDIFVQDDEHTVLWRKAARLAVLAAATVASGATIGLLRDDDEWRARVEAALAEACTVAAGDGVALETAGQWAIIETLPADSTTSTARDATAGRPTELEAITGSVVRAARRLGIATPALSALLDDARLRVAA